MSKSKKIFLLIAAVFLIILGYIGYDFSQKTQFPGSHKAIPTDSTNTDSTEISIDN